MRTTLMRLVGLLALALALSGPAGADSAYSGKGAFSGRGALGQAFSARPAAAAVSEPQAAANALIARMSTPPSAGRRTAIEAWFNAVPKTTRDKIGAIYMVGADAQASQLNWVRTGNDLTPVGTVVFLADRYFGGNGTDSYFTTGANLSAWAYNAQDSAHALLVTNSTSAYAGTGSAFGGSRYFMRANATFTTRVNDTVSMTLASAASTGRYGFSRIASTGYARFFNGAALADAVQASASLASQALELGRASGTTYVDYRISAFSIGLGLTPSEFLTLDAACLAYLQAIGAA